MQPVFAPDTKEQMQDPLIVRPDDEPGPDYPHRPLRRRTERHALALRTRRTLEIPSLWRREEPSRLGCRSVARRDRAERARTLDVHKASMELKCFLRIAGT